MNRPRILLVGVEAPQDATPDATVEVRGLCDPAIHQLLAAAPLYDYDAIIIYPKSYSHFLFGGPTQYSDARTELSDLKRENNDYDLGNAFDWLARSRELSVAIEKGTKVIWLATPDKPVHFYGQRSLYTGYVNKTPQEELSRAPLYSKSSTKLDITATSPFGPYFEILSEDGWVLCWDSRTPGGNVAITPEGYCLCQEFQLEQGTGWLLTPPPSPRAVNRLVKCLVDDTTPAQETTEGRQIQSMPTESNNQYILALKRCVLATFDHDKWLELGYLTDTINVIQNHPRLLRSLSFGDEDYGPRIFEVLSTILGDSPSNRQVVEDFVGLRAWLSENDRVLYARLYGTAVSVPTTQMQESPDAPSIRRAGELEVDVFISHASEDKSDVARPLAEELQRRGFTVWFDETSLKLGDSLSRSIDHGLANCRFGVVVLSPNFFAKEWPKKELAGLFAREVPGKKVILPVWHRITATEIASHSPMLADKLGASTSRGIKFIADQIESVLDA
jgi:hypothetical protein